MGRKLRTPDGVDANGKLFWTPAEKRAWEPPAEITVDQWAEANIVLPRSNANASGPLDLSVTPFAREPLQAMTDPDVEEITLCFAAQTTKTTILQATILYYLAEDPWPCLHVMPREDDAVSINVDRYQKIILESPNLRRFLTGAANDMTREAIRINGTTLDFVGANSPAALASRAKAILALDETDKYPPFSGREADPIALARERTVTYTNRKIIKSSSPTTERGYIWREFLRGDRRRFWLPCPHCGFFQTLILGSPGTGTPGVKLPENQLDPDAIIDGRLAWYECEGCHQKILDDHKPDMLRHGRWVPECQKIDAVGELTGPAPSRRLLSYHLSRLYAPWANSTFSHVIAEFLKSKSTPKDLMNFRNSWLAEVWEDTVDEVKGEHIRARIGGYEFCSCPPGAQLLTAGVDVGGDHLWYLIRAWGAGGESWMIRCGRVESWDHLDMVLFQAKYLSADRKNYVPLKMVMIDSKHRKSEVINYCRRTKCQAINGASRPLRPFTTSKHYHEDGTESPLVVIDTSFYKSKLHRLIHMRAGEPGEWHLPLGTPEEYITHMTAEQRKLVTDKKSGRTGFVWRVFPAGAPNHLFDTEVYALAASEVFDVEHSLQKMDPPESNPPAPAPDGAPTAPKPLIPLQAKAKPKGKPRFVRTVGGRYFS